MLMTIEANGRPILITAENRLDFDEEALRGDFYLFGVPDAAELSYREPFDEERDRWMRSVHEAVKEGTLESVEHAYESWACWLVDPTPEAVAQDEADERELEDGDDLEPVE